MSLKNTVKKNVRTAFRLIKDLGVDVVFTKVNATDFDFTTNSTTTETQEVKVVRAVLIKTTKSKEDNSTLIGELLLKSEDLQDPSVYDSIEMNGAIWSLSEYEDDGYVITAKISKER